MDKIEKIIAREVLNARGMPAVSAQIFTQNGFSAEASVPSGTSRGKHEAYELFDGGARYRGRGVQTAVQNIRDIISPALEGLNIADQTAVDTALIALDGTPDKSRLGANAILAVSVAASKCGAFSCGVPLYRALGASGSIRFPDLVATVLAGGEYSTSGLEFEDYMLVLHGFSSFADSVEALVSIRYTLEQKLTRQFGVVPEDGGALAPPLKSSGEAFDSMLSAAKAAGYENHVSLGLDAAASELYHADTRSYHLAGKAYTAKALSDLYCTLCQTFPLTFLEDPFDQDAFLDFHLLKTRLPHIQLVGDDLFATNPQRLMRGFEHDCANALLLKMNQIGTVTEAMEAGRLAASNGYDIIVSLRSGETTDDFIADLAVALNARQVKFGSPVRAERNAKYNRLMQIELEQTEGVFE